MIDMEIVLIVGKSNAGKSTLLRSLTGLGRGSNFHFDARAARNVADLHWGAGVDENPTAHKTVCINSSLNEEPGVIYPNDLGQILTHYEEQHRCSKGLICISSSKKISLAEYKAAIESAGFAHTVTHIVILSADNPRDQDERHAMFIEGAETTLFSRFAQIAPQNFVDVVPRNSLAARVRKVIGLV
jgi:energy-coupling factor transporter ATP-binding protein EcfA2